MPESSCSRLLSTAASAAAPPARVSLGPARLDARMGGGLPLARLHDLSPAALADRASATGFAIILARLAAGPDGAIVWLSEGRAERRSGALHGPGLIELGVDPARLLLVRAPDTATLLRVGADVVRSPAIKAAVIAPAKASPLFDLTATRRLTLFAERSGTTAFLLGATDPAQPSAAATRWRVAAAASTLLEADAPGHPAFAADLVRQRGGPPAEGWRLEWRRDAGHFASLPGAVPAMAGGGRMAASA